MRIVAAIVLAVLLAVGAPLRAADAARPLSTVSDLEIGYARLLSLWTELEGKNTECAAMPPPPNDLHGQIDQVAQLLGTGPAKDPLIRCWGRWSTDWNQRLVAARREFRERSPSPRQRGVDEMFALLGNATWDLNLLWGQFNRRTEGGTPDPSPSRERLRADLDPVRTFLRDQGEKAEDFERLIPKR